MPASEGHPAGLGLSVRCHTALAPMLLIAQLDRLLAALPEHTDASFTWN
ncbi:MAG: hypothetical protein PV358_05755 [Acidimicrobiales bacterium]|nr:hypothetical protein [Acidimicrobiales bacterium]